MAEIQPGEPLYGARWRRAGPLDIAGKLSRREAHQRRSYESGCGRPGRWLSEVQGFVGRRRPGKDSPFVRSRGRVFGALACGIQSYWAAAGRQPCIQLSLATASVCLPGPRGPMLGILREL